MNSLLYDQVKSANVKKLPLPVNQKANETYNHSLCDKKKHSQ